MVISIPLERSLAWSCGGACGRSFRAACADCAAHQCRVCVVIQTFAGCDLVASATRLKQQLNGKRDNGKSGRDRSYEQEFGIDFDFFHYLDPLGCAAVASITAVNPKALNIPQAAQRKVMRNTHG